MILRVFPDHSRTSGFFTVFAQPFCVSIFSSGFAQNPGVPLSLGIMPAMSDGWMRSVGTSSRKAAWAIWRERRTEQLAAANRQRLPISTALCQHQRAPDPGEQAQVPLAARPQTRRSSRRQRSRVIGIGQRSGGGVAVALANRQKPAIRPTQA